MKNLTFILLIIFCFSCKKDSIQVSGLENSRQAWETYKISVNNSYSYVRYSASVFGGYSESTIMVQNGKVIGRTFKSGVYQYNPTVFVERVSWTEDAATLNTHTGGNFPAVTIDQLYAEAERDYVNVDEKENKKYFKKDDKGLLAICGYFPKACQDDCFRGIQIKNIQPLK
ncbi:hypothetical protein [Mucilaginibacter myungsuensis]|uniref:Uncharacterized protein n=1 Tax=Mucilaginibacter myungsuensis TaxID=649104 RepID=A0A929PUQ1_9SPHI|nr:hypothetical protein [Mucilaginibacter myungsuensis]MBE9660349.1 hypothetical protein [Mucilaginibacter myungsuensis]MDN3600391.1 hypothetical protein [Mucilaginibacter myungsuensis]